MYDLVIIGGGPAGSAAAVYAARKQLKTAIITEEFGGQSTESEGIENWIGTISISGIDLGKSFKEHVEAYADDVVDIKTGERAEKIEQNDGTFKVVTNNGEYESKSILIATGSSRRKLKVPGAKEFENKGLTYCASCDGPLFKDQDVAVVGGGNAGLESAAQLMQYCKSVSIIHRHEKFKADEITVEKVLSHGNVKGYLDSEPVEVRGDGFVNGMVIENKNTGEKENLSVTGIFVEIGLIPATSFAEGLVEMNDVKQIKVDPKNQRTSVDGIWAAGDCTDGLYHQNNIAAGDAVKALEDLYLWVKKR